MKEQLMNGWRGGRGEKAVGGKGRRKVSRETKRK